MHLNLKAKDKHTYDAIVVGSGISGGWAAKELCEGGLKTLLLERGRDVQHVKDYPTATKAPWDFKHRGRVTPEELEKYPVQNRTGFTINEDTKHFFVNDLENPYLETKRFDWMRGYHLGGRSLMWGRQSYRYSDLDFEANAKEGIGADWPIRYKDLAPWYDHVERFAGINGERDGLEQLPDGVMQPPMPLNCIEEHVMTTLNARYPFKRIIKGRAAHLTQPTPEQTELGRASCQYRDLCMRGCPYGAYFSSQSATLPAARRTGNLTVRPHSIVNSVIYDETLDKATGVRVIDERTGEWLEFHAKVIFLNASTLGSTFILMNSTSRRYPHGLDESGQLGHNLMDHHFKVGADGLSEDFAGKYYYGRKPNGLYVPRFRNLGADKRDYLRGFIYEIYTNRQGWGKAIGAEGIGAEFKEAAARPGKWWVEFMAFGECLPYYENHVTLSRDKTDKWGQPVLKIDAEFKDNEHRMRVDMQNDAAEMLEAAGFRDVTPFDQPTYPGLGIHEMGTARMGRDPKTSVLNAWNQVHAARNVYVTDGACMTSTASQNPSLTYMALTARAAHHAVGVLKKGSV
jgi:choline dehydrogenase-like flavoprotein